MRGPGHIKRPRRKGDGLGIGENGANGGNREYGVDERMEKRKRMEKGKMKRMEKGEGMEKGKREMVKEEASYTTLIQATIANE